jgi:dihydroorotate dehydrogenase electron transfer subunit
MVGTGFGVATLAGFAEQAIARGVNVTLAVGAETATHVLPPHLLPDAVEYVVATADGTAGHAGSVVELLGGRIAWADGICAYASRTATRQLADVLRREAPRKPAQVAIVERMGCAMGVCLGCVVETTKGPLRTCTEGPVFDIHQLMLRDDTDVSDRTLVRIGE